MKRPLSFLFVLLIGTAALWGAPKQPLPAWETDAEKAAKETRVPFDLRLRIPPQNVPYGPAEFASMEGVVIQVQTYNTAIRKYYGDMINGIVAAQAMPYIIVENTTEKNNVVSQVLNAYGIAENDVTFLTYPYDANWTRDYGPWHIYPNKGTRALVDHEYYDGRPNDDAIPPKLGALWGDEVFVSGFYTEGGNFMTDGRGTCWMSTGVFDKNNMVDNEQNRAAIAQLFKEYVGCDRVFHPVSIPGEGTTHIDMYSKILDQDTIIVSYSSSEWGADAEELAQLDAAAELYGSIEKPGGGKYTIVRIPMTYSSSFFSTTYYTHTNSLIVNDHVLVPIYGRGTDEEALQIYRDLMPHHTIVGITSNEIIPQGGSIHCTTMQVPVKTYKACGDGVIGTGEQCEPLYLGGETCETLGYVSGDLACDGDCLFDVSLCVALVTCGNGTIDSGEVCDGGTIDCTAIAGKDYIQGTATCQPSCGAWDESDCESDTPDDTPQPDDTTEGDIPDETFPDDTMPDDAYPDGPSDIDDLSDLEPDVPSDFDFAGSDELATDGTVPSDEDTVVVPDSGKRAISTGCGCSLMF
ncbi:MAG TPA: agmatine deiminase family protein [bacterium]|nr:agmatine deiminase family protein [bacterium]